MNYWHTETCEPRAMHVLFRRLEQFRIFGGCLTTSLILVLAFLLPLCSHADIDESKWIDIGKEPPPIFNLRVHRKDPSFYGCHFAGDGKSGWVVGESGTILAIDRKGMWKPQDSNTSNDLNAVTFLTDSRRGWVVGEMGTIRVTDDGGQTWNPQTSPTEKSLEAIAFTSGGKHGWAVGSDGTILHTSNGGIDWLPQDSGTRNSLFGVSFLDNGKDGWVVGENGTILRTSTGGESWLQQSNRAVDRSLFSVFFSRDGKAGWAAGEGGTMLTTTDGGEAWKHQTALQGNDMYDLYTKVREFIVLTRPVKFSTFRSHTLMCAHF